MSQIYEQAKRRRPEKQWYELLWDVIKGVFVQVLFAIIDGVVVRIKEKIGQTLGYDTYDWRREYR